MNTGTHYVVAAYGVMLAALLLYCAFAAMRAGRIRREREVLARLLERRPADDTDNPATSAGRASPAGQAARAEEQR